MKQILLNNETATLSFGKDIAERIILNSDTDIEIHLHGDLGAGKTFLSRSIINSCGWDGMVKSPTYTLCEEYDLDNLLFLHIDLYRSTDAEDIDLFDIDREVKKIKIILIEWPEKLLSKRNPDIDIYLKHVEKKREVSVKIHSNKLLKKSSL